MKLFRLALSFPKFSVGNLCFLRPSTKDFEGDTSPSFPKSSVGDIKENRFPTENFGNDKLNIISHIKLALFLLLLSCSKNPIEKGNETDKLKVNYSLVNAVTETTVDLIWECSAPAYGIVSFGNIGIENVQFIYLKQKIQFLKLTSLGSGKTHNYQVGCIGERKALYLMQKFTTRTVPIPQNVINRGIWIVGGVGSANTPVGQIDLYDAVANTWYPSVTSMPTPRSYSGITALNNKIYVISGMLLDANGTSTISNVVEEYSPYTNTWKTLASIPVAIQGALAATSGNSIYLIGGSISSSSASAIPNIVYKITPDSSLGTWVTITSNSSIPARTDLSGCSMDGSIFFNSGRDTTGTAQFANDAYIASANSTTGITEGNFSLSRFGTSSTCYRPKPTDPYPSDAPGIFLAGGSTLGNTLQPPTAILASNRFDYYLTPSTLNTVQTGVSVPVNLYAPAAEVSYDLRRLYLFGGATIVNVPTSTIYSLDLSNPSTGPWVTLTTVMPTPRFGHSAILINR